jgi:hypothetical protein
MDENRPLSSRNWCLGSGRRRCSGTEKKQRMITPKPERQFWQATAGDGRPPATSQPESGDTRIGAAAGVRAHSLPRRRRRGGAVAAAGLGGRDTSGGPCRRRITRVEKPKRPSAAHAESLVVLGPGDGAGTNISTSLWISSPWRRGSDHNSAREPSLSCTSLWAPGSGGTGPAFREDEGGSTTGLDRLSPPQTR